MIMENFFIDDEFFSDFCSYMESRDFEEDNIPDDWSEMAIEGELQPMCDFSMDWIFDRLDEDRDDENGIAGERLVSLLEKHIDFKAIETGMPKLYYGTKRKFEITKQDLLNYCS